MWNKSNFLLLFLCYRIQISTGVYLPLVCIQKERLCLSRDRIQSYDLRRAVWSLSSTSIRYVLLRTYLLRNSEGTKPANKGSASSMGIMVGVLDVWILRFWLTPHFSSPPPQCSLLPWSVPSLAQGCAAAAWPGETWTTVKSRKKF